jgi:hypothetical protein
VRRLACSVARKLSILVFLRVSLPFPQFVPLHLVTRVQFRLITILENCGCVVVVSFYGVPLYLDTVHIINHMKRARTGFRGLSGVVSRGA